MGADWGGFMGTWSHVTEGQVSFVFSRLLVLFLFEPSIIHM